MTDQTEPTLAQTYAAAEAVRGANHSAYQAPKGDTANLYDRTGSVHDLLTRTEQLVQVLGEQVERLAQVPELRTTEEKGAAAIPTLAVMRAMRAAADLAAAARSVGEAKASVNDAWSGLSSLYVDAPGEDE